MTAGRSLEQKTVALVAALMLISWIGEWIHNLFEFPGMSVLAPENSGPLALSVILFVLWWRAPHLRPTTQAVIIAWTLAHFLIGAVITIIPFGFLPFYPEQTPGHYVSHVIYGVAQIPLLIYLFRQMQNRSAAA